MSNLREQIAKIICYTKPSNDKDAVSLGGFVDYAAMLPVKWSNKNFTVPADLIISAIADDIEKTTIKVPFEAEGYIAGAKDEHAYIVKYLRGLLDN